MFTGKLQEDGLIWGIGATQPAREDTQLEEESAMNKIILRRSDNCWTAEYLGEHRPEIVSLFGTAVLPTAFVARANLKVVRREIEKLNPECEVEIGGSDA